MFRITKNPSSGSLVQCLAKNYKNDSIVSVHMDKVGVMAAPVVRVCRSLYLKALIYNHMYTVSSYTVNYTMAAYSDLLCVCVFHCT